VGLLSKTPRRRAAARFRSCRIEQMESRQLLSVSVAPLHVAAVYFEDSNDQDASSALVGAETQVADLFQISYTGGADGTQLTSLTLQLDKTFFDPGDNPEGVYGSFPLTILSHNGFEIVSTELSSDYSTLTFNFNGFDAGEKLVFTVDVDERENGEVSAVAEGIEFQGAALSAVFTAPHTETAVVEGLVFYDKFDKHYPEFAGSSVASLLPNDDYDNAAALAYMPELCSPGIVYTALAYGVVQQTPLSSISGTVFYDLDADNVQDSGEQGIGGVTLTLYVLDGSIYTSTERTTTTAEDGSYAFLDLSAGTYRVVETQPDGYVSVGAAPGTVDGLARGKTSGTDVLTSIVLGAGEDCIDNDFAETRLASLCGYVYVDADNDGVYDPGETPLEGVEVALLDASGNATGQTAATNADGLYCFRDLMPGVYGVSQTQPEGYFDGIDTAGTLGGVAHNPGDLIDEIVLSAGAAAQQNNFGELLPAAISGRVYADLNNNGQLDADDVLLNGVTVYLLDASGARIGSTTTNAAGKYAFTNLTPGVYGVEEVQPAAYLEGGNQVGSAGGALDGFNRILQATLNSGTNGVNYDFWEIVPATISGYVFQDGGTILVQKGSPAPNIASLRDGILTSDDVRLSGITLVLCDASGNPLLDAQGNQITTATNAQGYYEFNRLYPGQYSVIEVLPTGYLTGITTAGNLGGTVVNPYANVDSALLSTLAVTTSDNAIVRITLGSGEAGVNYNFSHVLIDTYSPPPEYPPPYVPPTPTPPLPPVMASYAPYQHAGLPHVLPPQISMPLMAGGSGGPGGYSWHLSIIDAGNPRGNAAGEHFVQYVNNTRFDPISWSGAEMDQTQWTLADEDGNAVKTVRFGMAGALPVVGDWNGSGTTKLGVFLGGLWFLDLDGDGIWDEVDLWAKLGKEGDQPVSGDWNGDGKTDIGIYGQAWIGDLKAIMVEPGLPDAQNRNESGRPKNIPPNPADAAVGWRTLKTGRDGALRSDLIDHVFQYGTKGDRAVVGDWNGDGIYSVGVFREGRWFLDLDGDGRWSAGDLMVDFGQAGDLPVVGDWNGDGISQLGVYRDGKFILDVNNNRQIDATDKVFQLGQAGDLPVVGDWNGDGVDQVGVYHNAAAPSNVPLQAARQ